jgi:hypothetical protein
MIIEFILQAFPQPKAIRGNDGYYRQETVFPGSSGNLKGQQLVQKPIFPPAVQANPAPKIQQRVVNIPQPIITQPLVDQSIVRSVQNRQKLNSFPTAKEETLEELEKQANSAYYKFGTSVHDTINDHEHIRQEERNGLALRGLYSYSDGFFRRTVYYEADEGGYRVTKEEIQPIGDGEGPKFHPKGQADVKSSLSGDYTITVHDFKLNKKQTEALEQQV